MFNFHKLFTSQYLFNFSVLIQRSDKILLGLGVAGVVLAIVFKIAAVLAPNPVDKKYREQLYKLFLTIGLCEAVWFAFRYETIRFFGTHFVAFFILFIGLVWLAFIVRDVVRHYKADKELWQKEQVKLKYLPK